MPNRTDNAVKLREAGTLGKFDLFNTHPDTMRECDCLPHSCLLTYGRRSHCCLKLNSTILLMLSRMVMNHGVKSSMLALQEWKAEEWLNEYATQLASKLTVTGKDATPPHRNVKWASEEVRLLLSLWSIDRKSVV